MSDVPEVPDLPEPRAGGDFRVALVCLGNICRSPTAHVVLEDEVARAGLADRVSVVSAGTGGWHVGGPMDRRAAAALVAAGYDPSEHRARQFDATWFEECDLVLVMDDANHRDVAALAPDVEPGRLRLFRDFDPLARPGDREVPDPFFGDDDGFTHVLTLVRRTSAALARRLADHLG